MNDLIKYEGLGGRKALRRGIQNFTAFQDYVFSSNAFAVTINSWAQSPHDALLLHGDYGTGKSELATRLPVYMEKKFQYAGAFHLIDCANSKFCPQKDIVDKLNFAGLFGTPYFVLEEADQLSARHQVTLRHIIQQYSHLLNVVLTTNELNKIDKGVRSRSIVLKVVFPDIEHWTMYVRKRLGTVSVKLITDEQILKVLRNLGCASGRDVNRAVCTIKSELGI